MNPSKRAEWRGRVYGITDRQTAWYGRIVAVRGSSIWIVDSRGIVKGFHARYVEIDWGARMRLHSVA